MLIAGPDAQDQCYTGPLLATRRVLHFWIWVRIEVSQSIPNGLYESRSLGRFGAGHLACVNCKIEYAVVVEI
jgi:hypothetical protein